MSKDALLKITIVNCATDHNKGAAAIACGLIRRLEASDLVKQISVVSLYRKVFPKVDFRHLIQCSSRISISPSPIYFRGELSLAEGALRRVIERSIYPPYVLAAACGNTFGHFRTWVQDREPGAQAIVDSDIVLNRGGPFFAAGALPPNASLLAAAWPFLYASQSGRPYAFIGETVGPFGNIWARRLARSLFGKAEFIGVRERFSSRVLFDLGLSDKDVVTMLDNAFWVEPRTSQRVREVLTNHNLLDKKFLAVTCRPWGGNANRYVGELALTINSLLRKTFDHVVLVPNTYNPAGPHLDDRDITTRVFQEIERPERVSLVNEDFAPDELSAFYGFASCLLGTRLHSVILALNGGTPVVGISYAGWKTSGVMDFLGLGNYVLKMEELDHDVATRRVAKAVTEQQSIAPRLDKLRAAGDAIFHDFLKSIPVR